MFLLTGIIMVILFLISTSVPILGWVLPFYKIKRLDGKSLSTKILANIVAIIVIALLDVKFLITYFGVFMVIEYMYFMFKKYGKKIEIFDRIFITTLLIGALASIYIYINMDNLNLLLEQIKGVYAQKTDFSKTDIDFAFGYMKQNFVFLSFLYAGITVFLTYYFTDHNSFKTWKISYLWLIPYIIFFFLEKYSNLDARFITQGVNIFKIIYVMYFIRVVTSLVNSKSKNQALGFIIGFLLVLMSPIMAFVVGGLASLLKIKIVVQK